MHTRVAAGRARVVREIRAAGPLTAAVAAPVLARGPWLTAVLNVQAAQRPPRIRPVAVVVERDRQDRPDGLALLVLRRRGLGVAATLLGDGVEPLPGGRPTARIPVRDDDAAAALAAGVLDLLASLRRPWTLRLAGLPLGDPTLRALGRLRPEAAFGNARSWRLVDELDQAGAVRRSRDPRELERWLPALLTREPDRRARAFLRAAARLHAATGELELAVVADGDRLRAGLLTLVDDADRWPWWGSSDVGGLRREMGSPVVGLTLAEGLRGAVRISRRSAGR
ncbi:MAG TPA: GNAT family N-acetyltransferase [Geodermatophilus sp.]|nr:GNAT family N-acetyltransferase [Geodermatophilus sp.]